jgi:hypothetical protein
MPAILRSLFLDAEVIRKWGNKQCAESSAGQRSSERISELPLRDPLTLLCCSIRFRATWSGFLTTADFQGLLKTAEAQVDVLQETVVETRGDTRASFLAPATGC